MKKLISTRIISLAACLALFAGCVTEQAPPPGPESPPPPETEVIPPQPNVTFVWTPGFWDWQGRWIWRSGYWGPRPRPGAVWVQGRWVHHGHRDVWVRPHWQ
ncbi:MAG TPA: hypothetical protein VH280_20025 [Verrucomicrobiae bacterium]|nr:hypothetical protein [Verrucomicrobiae bacterium]